MIIEFKTKNFRSIWNPQTFSLVASSDTEHDQNTFHSGNTDSLRLLRASVIYGANASGKSNLLDALSFMRFFVVSCAKESQLGEKIPVENFSFNEKSRLDPTEFEVSFIKEDVRYQYGFVIDEDRVHEEWLFAYPTGRAQQWFSRVYDKKNDEYSWKFSKYFKYNKQIVNLTLKQVLFLSNAVKLNNEQLAPVFTWFQKDLLFIDPDTWREFSNKKSIDYIKEEKGKEWILQFMRAADPSIADIEIEKSTLPFLQNSNPKQVDENKIRFMHSEKFSLDLKRESEGTRRLLEFAGHWIDALENGGVLIVDELDKSLHPLLVRFLINLICNPEINKKNAQLIFTTHDTSLLDNAMFRRDQIWFVEKDKNNATQLYPLLDFSPRKHEAIGRGYLQGRYGALPYIGEWRF